MNLSSWAQVRVDMSLNRLDFLQYENVTAKVKITNMSSRPLIFGEVEDDWLTFRLEDSYGNIMPVRKNYRQAPYIKIDPSVEAEQSINLTPLYSFHNPGRYKVRAIVSINGKTFSSLPKPLEIREGKLIWEEQVGLTTKDNQEEFRIFSLIQFPRVGDPFLYLQVRDENSGLVYTTTRLGPVINPSNAVAEFDKQFNIHILFQTHPKAYGYYEADKDGRQIDTAIYTSYNSNPKLKIDAQRLIGVFGGQRQADENSATPPAPRFIPPPLPPGPSKN
ncbi:MAG: hypothetical protein SGI98_05805 [Verrucomicrobiota bacterium]|nr:hypothetical protein [Verrucomicrobiota bacterium]